MNSKLSLKKAVGILWILAFVSVLALVWLALPTWEAQAGITSTPTSPPADTPVPPTNTPQPLPTNTPKPDKDDDDNDDGAPPPSPTETPAPTATPTEIPPMLPQTGEGVSSIGIVSSTWVTLIGLGVLGLILFGPFIKKRIEG